MIFLLLLYTYYQKRAAQKAAAEVTDVEHFETSDAEGGIGLMFATLFGIITGIYAVYLSWSCNTQENVSVIGKLFFAFWAWVFGVFYILFYWLVRAPSCGFM